MTQLIVLDASVVIAVLSSEDAHHQAATSALASAGDDELVLATTRAEILVGPSRAGGSALAKACDFIDGCSTVPISANRADDAAALKAQHQALSLPDALALTVAESIDADAVWTFDQRWRSVHPRVKMPWT